MHVYKETSRPGMSATLLTPTMMPEKQSCVGFYYQVRAGQMTVNVRTPQLPGGSTESWKMTKLPTEEWEFAYIKILQAYKYFRIAIEAKHSENDNGVNIALDDLVFETCDFGKW